MITITEILPNSLWKEIYPILLKSLRKDNKEKGGRPIANTRTVLATILLHTGSSWKFVDRIFDIPKSTAHHYLTVWSSNGVLKEIYEIIQSHIDIDLRSISIDTGQVRSKKRGNYTGRSPVDR